MVTIAYLSVSVSAPYAPRRWILVDTCVATGQALWRVRLRHFILKIAFNDWGVDIKRIGSRCGRLREKNKVHDDDKTVEKSFAEKESAVPGLFYFLSFS